MIELARQKALAAGETLQLVRARGRDAQAIARDDAKYRGRYARDERYVVLSPPAAAA